jgi:hypothetical protein
VEAASSSRSAPARFSSRCLSVFAPTIGAVTVGRLISQLRAIWLGVASIELAMSRTTSRVAQFWSLAASASSEHHKHSGKVALTRPYVGGTQGIRTPDLFDAIRMRTPTPA